MGDRVLVNNGLLIFQVTSLTDTDVICTVIAGGEISDRKSMSFPNKVLQAGLPERSRTKSDLLFGIEHRWTLWPALFVSCRQDLLDVKEFLSQNGGDDIELIAKIENQSGIDNIEEICQECSGIMIGRGDMGGGDPLRGAARGPEAADHQVPPAGQADYHRYGDAGIHDPQSPAHPGGDL